MTSGKGKTFSVKIKRGKGLHKRKNETIDEGDKLVEKEVGGKSLPDRQKRSPCE